MHLTKKFVLWVFVGFFSNTLFSQSQPPLPLVIAKRGDVAPGSLLPTGTSDLIFNALSAPSVTTNGRRAAFVASLTSGLNNTENRKTIWFADLQEDGYYDLKQAAATGMPVQGLTAEDEGMVLNLGTISAYNLDNTLNLPPIALDPEGRNVAFVARLSTPETAGEDFSGDSAVFIASDSGIRLAAKENDEFTVTISTDFGSSDELFVLRGFLDLQYINNRLVFRAGNRFSGSGVFEYAGGTLNPLFLSPGSNPNAYDDPTQGEIRVSSIRTLGLNETGALAFFIRGITKIDAKINGSRDVDAIRFRPSAGQDFVSVAKTWDEFAGYPNRFFRSPAEMSINEAGGLLVKANLGFFDEGTPTYPSDSSAIIYYTLKTTGSNPGGEEVTSQVLVATGDLAEGVSLEGDAATINRLEAVQVSQDYGSYLAHYPGEEGSFFAHRALYRTRLAEGGPGEPIFYVNGPPNVNGVGTVTGILNYLLGPRGDLIALVTTTDAEALIHVSAPGENGDSTYTLLAESFSNLNFNCEGDCNSFEPRLVTLGFIPGGNLLGPVVGPETGLGGPINKHYAGWMLFDVFSNERNEAVVVFPTGEPVDLTDPPYVPPLGLDVERKTDSQLQVSLRSAEEKDYEVWDSVDLVAWRFFDSLSGDPASPLPKQLTLPTPQSGRQFFEIRQNSPAPSQPAPPTVATASGIQAPVLYTGNGGRPSRSFASAVISAGGAVVGGGGSGIAHRAISGGILPVTNEVLTGGKVGSLDGINVSPSTGEFQAHRQAIKLRGLGEADINVIMAYRSQLNYEGFLGYGWTHSYNQQLLFQPDDSIHYFDATGTLTEWLPTSDSFYQCNAHFGKLKNNGDGSFTLREKDGFKQHFNDEGKLYCQEDRFGNEVNLYYDNRNTLSHLLDSYGRRTDFYHGQMGGKERLLQIVDFTGRTVDFHYDENLLAGMTLSHLYTDDLPREERYGYNENKLLNAITFPEEAATNGPPVVQCDYQQLQNGDWAVSSFHVGGTNASGVEAGGTTILDYNQEAKTVTCTDSEGGVIDFGFNDQHQLSFQVQYMSQEPFEIRTEFSHSNHGLPNQIIWPLGNSWEFTHDESGNWITFTSVPDEVRGGDPITWARTYEPLFCQLASETDPRGNDPSFVPPMGEQSMERYTRRWYFDYQESEGSVLEAMNWGIDTSAVERGLGDVNGDGRTDQQNGNPVWQEGPHVNLDPASNLAQETGSTVQAINWYFEYNDWGQKTTTQNAVGIRTTYFYNPNNDPDGNGQTIPGNNNSAPNGFLKTITQDPGGFNLSTHHQWDDRGNQTGITNPRGVLTKIDHNSFDEIVRVVEGADVSMAITMGELPEGTQALAVQTSFEWNNNRNLTAVRQEIDPETSNIVDVGTAVETYFTYDILGQLIKQEREISAGVFAITEWAYDGNGNRTSQTDPNGNEIIITYGERGLINRTTHAPGTDVEATHTLNHDANGNPIEFVDAEDHDDVPGGEPTKWAYDGHDRLVGKTLPDGTTQEGTPDPVNNITNQSVFDGSNNLLNQTNYTHDELNRTCRVERPVFVSPDQIPIRQHKPTTIVELYEHDAMGRTRYSTTNGHGTIEYAYDERDRLRHVSDPEGNTIENIYDSNGNVVTETQTRVATAVGGETPPPKVVDELSYAYDQLDRVVGTTDSLNNSTGYAYNRLGDLTAFQNKSGDTETHHYDGLGRRVRKDQQETDGENGEMTTSYGYDAGGNLTAKTDGNGNTTWFGNDARDRRTSVKRPDGSTWNYSHDRDNNLVSTTDPNGTQFTHTYNGRNLRTQTNVIPGAGVRGATQQTFTYDGLGTPITAVDGGSTVGRVSDSLGRIVEENQGVKRISYGYDRASRNVEVTNSTETRVETSRDLLGRAIQLSVNPTIGEAVDLITDIAYQGHLPTLTQLGNGLNSSDTRDLRGQINNWTVSDNENNNLINRAITYTPDGFPKTVTDENGESRTYAYDSANRVVKDTTTDSGGETARDTTLAYNDAHNRTEVNVQEGANDPETIRYDANDQNNYTEIGTQPQVRDSNGNLTDDGTFSYFYDAFNRLVEVRDQDGNVLVQYVYDAYDRRIQRIETGADGTPVSNHRYVYDGNKIIEVWDAESDALLASYIWLNSTLVSKSDETGDYYVHTDPQGNVVAVTDETGEIVTEQSFDAFGNPTVEQGELFEMGYRSWWVDPTTGFSFVNGRDYNPETGRTIQNSAINPVIGSQPQFHLAFSAGGLFSLVAPVPIPIDVNPLDPRARLDNFLRSRPTDAINPPSFRLPRRTNTAPRPGPRFDYDDDYDDDDRPGRPTFFPPPGYNNRPVVSSILKEVGSALIVDYNFYNPIEPEIPRLPIQNNRAFSADLIAERIPIENNFAFSAGLISNEPLLSLAELAFITITEYNIENPPELVLRPVVYRPVIRKPKYVKSILGDVRSSLVIP